MSDANTCEFPRDNATNEEIDSLLSNAGTIAVVGLSANPERISYEVAAYLQRNGFRIIPINPAASEVLGEKAYPDLASVPGDIDIDIVDIFRKPEHIPAVVDDAIARGAGAVWMQLGLAHNTAADTARAAGLTVVMDRCTKIEHRRFASQGRS